MVDASLFREFQNYNKNIKLAMISSIFVMSSNGLLVSAIFSIFVKGIGGSDLIVGYVSFFGGLVLLVGILPAGLLADRFSRKLSLRLGLVFLFFGFLSFYLSNNLFNLYIAFGIFNLGNAFIRPSRDALIADSVINNKREKIYGQLFFLQRVSNGLGPLFAVFLFLIIGDNWHVETMKQVLFIGLFGLIIGIIIMFFMDDKYSLGSESESTNHLAQSTNVTSKPLQFIKNNNIALFILFLGLIISIGAGMTVRFFPIFFKEDYNLPPSIVNFIYFLVAFATGIIAILVTKYVHKIGKIESIVTVQVIAIVSLFIIALIPPISILIPIFLIRGSFMNASQPVKNAMIMDLVPKRNRGIFQSLQVLTERFFWSFSAGIGGVLLSFTSFPVLYITTGTIYIFGTLPFLLLINKMPNNKLKKTNVNPVGG